MTEVYSYQKIGGLARRNNLSIKASSWGYRTEEVQASFSGNWRFGLENKVGTLARFADLLISEEIPFWVSLGSHSNGQFYFNIPSDSIREFWLVCPDGDYIREFYADRIEEDKEEKRLEDEEKARKADERQQVENEKLRVASEMNPNLSEDSFIVHLGNKNNGVLDVLIFVEADDNLIKQIPLRISVETNAPRSWDKSDGDLSVEFHYWEKKWQRNSYTQGRRHGNGYTDIVSAVLDFVADTVTLD